jgi:hypothetical protein
MPEFVPADIVSSTWSQQLQPPGTFPASADVVIIGGGIVGVSTAWFLTQQGVDVVVCEKGHIAGEQSGRNWGWVRQQLRDTREMPMIVESLKIWRTLAADIGEDVGFHEQGILIAARNDKEARQYVDWIRVSDEYGVETRFIEGDELASLVRGATVKWKGALYTPSDGRAEPHKATTAPRFSRPVRCVASKPKAAPSRPWSPNTVSFGHRRCCVRPAHGRQCSAVRWA